MAKFLNPGSYKLSYDVKYQMTYYDPFGKKNITLTHSFPVKSQRIVTKQGGLMKNFFLQLARKRVDAKLKSYQLVKSSKLLKVKNLKVVELIKKGSPKKQIFYVAAVVRYTFIYAIEGEHIESAPYVSTIHLTIAVAALTEDIVLRAAKQYVYNLRNSTYYWTKFEKLISWNQISKAQIEAAPKYSLLDHPMTEAFPISYSWIPAVQFAANSMCVYSALASLKVKPVIFKKPLKLLALFQEYEDADAALENREARVLTLTSGVTPRMIHTLCSEKEYDITHYCIDISEKTQMKYISKNQNYSPICYATHDGHMYLVTDKDFINKLSFRRHDQTAIIGMLRRQLDQSEGYEIKNPISTWSIDTLHTLKDCTIIDETLDALDDVFIQIYSRDRAIYAHKSKEGRTIYIKYKNNVTIMVDPNACLHLKYSNGKKNVTWKTVQMLCELKKIPFTNQSFPSLVIQIIDQVMKPVRVQFSKAEKKFITDQQQNKCNICDEACKSPQFDHIIPLAAGGTNETDNIQALCKECHFDKTKQEQDNGDYCSMSPVSSTFNGTTRNIILSDLFKRFAFIERIGLVPSNRKTFYIDINKCRRNNMLHMKQNGYLLPVFTCMDEPKIFNPNEKLAPGFYLIETDLYLPCRGNGWYSYALITYLLEQKLIQLSNIKYVLASGLSLEGDYFNKALDALTCLPDGLDKPGPNILAGLFNKSHTTRDRLFYTTNFNYASQIYMESNTNDVFIQEIDPATNLYQVRTSTRYDLDIVNSGIYHLILDLEAMELHKMKAMIEKAGGHVTFFNTDCCECWFDNDQPMDLKNEFWDVEKKLPKFKYEKRTIAPSMEAMKQWKRTERFTFAKPEWKVIADPGDKDFGEFAKELLATESDLNVDGCGGSGKTTLIRKIKTELLAQNKKYVVLAPTNKACRQVCKEAKTIHKFVAKAFTDMKALSRTIKDVDYIIVDEVSMVKEIFFKVFASIRLVKPSIRFIFGGDERQIPPPCDRVEFSYKDALVFHELCNNTRVQLTKCRRSDKAIFDLSQNVNAINIATLGKTIERVSICYTNPKRVQINSMWMERDKKKAKWTIEAPKLEWDLRSQAMTIYEGLPVIARVNAKLYDIANNETFKVVGKEGDSIRISDDETKQEKLIPAKDMHKVFHPGYCLTTHRAQGSTIDQPFTILEWGIMSTRLRYTALTRGTMKEYLNILL